ncbi:hypothetical protein SAMN06295905_0718 [Devosia lucknowensis]|uniref:DUF6898 domain-containing protein n=1 Tax=Devosia lucknowensis TaxID=1096929 RepID=A0A1Y6EP96_9HYPH|nr:hypothetical protein [Devosia lucknowensis]SMQ62790.1 hypothetical protein SAMN06295905_0718 [Devosia lucknowensis]
MGDGEVLFEFIQVGQQMRVAAVDAATGIEVVVIAPLNSARGHMQRLALAKLRRRLAQDAVVPTTSPGKYA